MQFIKGQKRFDTDKSTLVYIAECISFKPFEVSGQVYTTASGIPFMTVIPTKDGVHSGPEKFYSFDLEKIAEFLDNTYAAEQAYDDCNIALADA